MTILNSSGSVGVNSVPSCKCEDCRNACRHKPGWFLPEETEAVKKHFGAETIQELLGKNRLAVDWWEVKDGHNILVLAPNIKNNDSIQYPQNPTGECVFFRNDRTCSIYAVRPAECRAYHHDYYKTQHLGMHAKTAAQWKKQTILTDFAGKIRFKAEHPVQEQQ